VVKRAVFADDHDDVFDGAASVLFLSGLKSARERATQTELKDGQGDESNAKTMEGV
jgi:hypothetical protein